MNMGVYLRELYLKASDRDKKIIIDYLKEKSNDIAYKSLYDAIMHTKNIK